MKRLSILVLITLCCCSSLSDFEEEYVPPSWGKFAITPVANEVLLRKLYPDLGHSECGLGDDDFIRYTRDRIDYTREFQFIVFISGKPLVGKECLRRALIFYLK